MSKAMTSQDQRGEELVADADLIDAISIIEDAIAQLMNADHVQITTAEGWLVGEIKPEFPIIALLCHALDYLENQLSQGDFYHDTSDEF